MPFNIDDCNRLRLNVRPEDFLENNTKQGSGMAQEFNQNRPKRKSPMIGIQMSRNNVKQRILSQLEMAKTEK